MNNPRNYSYHVNSTVNQRRRRRYLRRLNLYRLRYGVRTQTNDAIFLSMIIRLPPQSSNDHYVNEFFNGSSFPWIRRIIENVEILHIKHIIKCIYYIKNIYLYNYSYYYRYRLVIIDIDSVLFYYRLLLQEKLLTKLKCFASIKSETICYPKLWILNLEMLL